MVIASTGLPKWAYSWKLFQSDQDRETHYLTVPGGRLYLVHEKGDMGGILHQSMVFVPSEPRRVKP